MRWGVGSKVGVTGKCSGQTRKSKICVHMVKGMGKRQRKSQSKRRVIGSEG